MDGLGIDGSDCRMADFYILLLFIRDTLQLSIGLIQEGIYRREFMHGFVYRKYRAVQVHC